MADTKVASIPLRDALRDGRAFEAALVSTFNVDFHFVEDVVLRYLKRTDIHYLVLLADARHVGDALLDPDRAPAQAGRGYALLPIAMNGAFHPKCTLMVGEKAGRLIIGSHNATLPGFGLNRELTNVIDIAGPSDAEGSAALVEAFDFHRAWAADLPAALTERLDDLARFVTPYRSAPAAPSAAVDTIVLGSRPDGPDLWSRLRPHLPATASRIATLGPFYDKDLTFIRKLHSDFGPKRLAIGVEPARTSFPNKLPTLPAGATVVNVRDIDPGHKGRGIIHGKAILMESGREHWLVTGSANPTAAAWLEKPKARNAELIVARRLKPADLEALGLDVIWSSPAVTAADLATMVPPGKSQLPTSAHRPLLGICQKGYITIDGAPADVTDLQVRDTSGVAMPVGHHLDGSSLVADLGDRAEAAATFELASHGQRYPGIVMHPAELRDAAESHAQRKLRDLIDGLDGAIEGMECWLATVDRLFSTAPPAPTSKATGGHGTPVRKGHKSPSSHVEDFSSVVSYLMRHLWRQLPHAEPVGFASRAPDPLSEDDDAPPLAVDDERIALAVEKKTRTLLQRLGKRLALPGDPVQQVRETIAVLGMLHRLRRTQEQDRWRFHDLVDREALVAWYPASVPLLLRKNGVIDLASKVPGNEQDIAFLLGLLVWAAWMTGASPGEILAGVDPKDRDADHTIPLEALAATLLLATRIAPVVDRARVSALLAETPFPDCEPEPWLEDVLRLGALGLDAMTAPVLDRIAHAGDLVRVGSGARVLVCMTLKETGPELIDFDQQSRDPRNRATFRSTHVKVIAPEAILGG